jgi:hypothetical protein
VILVAASELDSQAQQLVENWPRKQAVLMTPRDLCTKGWRIELGRIEAGCMVASGESLAVGRLRGILNLLPYVSEYELITIESASRRYVAAEITALLFYLLTVIRCPVLNRPTANNLTGPDWRPEQWAQACRKVGIPTKKVQRNSRVPTIAGATGESFHSISAVGNNCVGGDIATYAAEVIALARFAGLIFLTVTFVESEGGRFFHSAQLAPDLRDGNLTSAIQAYFGDC